MPVNVLTCYTGDGMQHSCSWLHDLLTTKLPAEFHVVLDEAFKCWMWFLLLCFRVMKLVYELAGTTQELSPWPRPRQHRLSVSQDAFNFHLSLQRQVIERCFAMLTWRWGVFWRPIKVAFGSIKDLVACCCRCVMCNDVRRCFIDTQVHVAQLVPRRH